MQPVDTFLMSLDAIRSNKLRSVLTLVGIILGVASIIGVMTAMTIVQRSIEKEMSVFGAQTFRVQKVPRGFASDAQLKASKHWPPVTLAEAREIREAVKSVDSVGTELRDYAKAATYRGITTKPTLAIVGGTPEYSDNNSHYVELGRNISTLDVMAARKVVVLAHSVAEELFPFSDPIGKKIRLDGQRYEVVGVFLKKVSAFGARYETLALIPISAYINVYGEQDAKGLARSVDITLHAKNADVMQDAVEETRQTLRRLRHLQPGVEDNFFYFTTLSAIDGFNEGTRSVKIGAFLIGTISLVVAGIGIMNIMLVSVTERTKEIGIRKSLGARRKDILWQFLLEAMLLSNVGGLIGIAIGLGLGNVLALVTSFEGSVPMQWVILGMVFCSVIGVTFGMLPALKASRLNPIEALRYE